MCPWLSPSISQFCNATHSPRSHSWIWNTLLSASVTPCSSSTTPWPIITILLQEIPIFLENSPPSLEGQDVFSQPHHNIIARSERFIPQNNQSTLLPTTKFYRYVDGALDAKLMTTFKYDQPFLWSIGFRKEVMITKILLPLLLSSLWTRSSIPFYSCSLSSIKNEVNIAICTVFLWRINENMFINTFHSARYVADM